MSTDPLHPITGALSQGLHLLEDWLTWQHPVMWVSSHHYINVRYVCFTSPSFNQSYNQHVIKIYAIMGSIHEKGIDL